jgi:hypothetical protein
VQGGGTRGHRVYVSGLRECRSRQRLAGNGNALAVNLAIKPQGPRRTPGGTYTHTQRPSQWPFRWCWWSALNAEWKPLSRRGAGAATEALSEGIPGHLWAPLEEWFEEASTPDRLRSIALRTRVEFGPGDFRGLLRVARVEYGEEKALDVIDAMLYEGGENPGPRPGVDFSAMLERILQLGGSAWRVSSDGDGLERRLETSVRDALDKSIEVGADTSAGQHLSNAFAAAYGREPDSSKAYAESIKAVEAAASPVITPNDLKATLGTIIGEMRTHLATYEFAISPGSPDTALAIMTTLWNGHTDRHGGNLPTVPITSEAGEAAVHLAAALVHWFASGAVRRRLA